MPLNKSALAEYEKELNFQANLREYVIQSVINLTITTPNSIKLQSLSLVQLTQPTNQLTRTTLVGFSFCLQKSLKYQIDACLR
jgi:hypothetical protein